jgi:hypothetical protein
MCYKNLDHLSKNKANERCVSVLNQLCYQLVSFLTLVKPLCSKFYQKMISENKTPNISLNIFW